MQKRASLDLEKSKILIIDDDADLVELLRRILVQKGYDRIESATDRVAAIRQFRGWQPDLVVLDLLMRGVSGLELLVQLREIIPLETHLPILVLTGDSSIETRREVLSRGATDFLAKPYDTAEILARIGNLLETRFLHLQLATKQEELEVRSQRLADANAALRAEVAARERFEVKLRAVTESVGDAIVSAEAEGKIIFWNRAAERIFGYHEDEVLGKPLTLIMPERYREKHRAGMARVQAGGEPRIIGRTIELAGLRKDGSEFPTELTLSTWKAGGVGFYTGVLRDITQRHGAQEALRKAHAELTAANQRLLFEARERREPGEALRKSAPTLACSIRSWSTSSEVRMIL